MPTFRVTQEDIENGKAGDECRCPVALCLRRHFESVEVCDDTLSIDGQKYLSPDKVCSFVGKFDAQKAVEPFEFELDLGAGLPDVYQAE